MRLSIITPSLNQHRFLVGTAESILGQHGDFELEWIVMDGGSTDGSVAFLAGLNDRRIHLTSAPDTGQSNAINKAMLGANGDIVAWLNADDLYTPGALAAVVEAFTNHPDARWLIGQCQIIDADDRPIRAAVKRYKERRLSNYSYRALLRENFIPQPAVFWRADFGRRVGPLDESLHWTMDYDLWLRMGQKCPPLVLDTPLARFRLHTESKSGRFNRRQYDEGYQVASRYFNGDWMSRIVHRINLESIVWAYRAMRLMGK